MATHVLTPAERRARATMNQQREAYENYLKAEEERKKAEEERNGQNGFVRFGYTLLDIGANVLTGAAKGLEGIWDLGAGAVGAIGGLFDKDFENGVKEHISYDIMGNLFANSWQEELNKNSYLEDWGKAGNIIEGVSSGVGQMLPAVAVSVATGGAGTAASLATLGASAAGNSTEQAFNDGADYYRGLGYGLASGAVEMATEKMFGGATKALTGAGLMDSITGKVASTGVRRITKNALEEGVEEIASELVNPSLKSIYKGKDAFSEYATGDYWKGVAEAGVVGSLTALAYSGSVGYGMAKITKGYTGKELDISDSLTEISSLKDRASNLQADNRLDANNEIKIAATTKKNYENIQKVLQSVKEDKRAKLIEKFSLDKAFNIDGTMSENLSSMFNGQAVADGENTATSPLASPDKAYFSYGLRGDSKLQAGLDKINSDSRNAETPIRVFNGKLSDKGQANFTQMKKGINALNRAGGKMSFVVVNENKTFNGTVVDGVMYIGADTLENDNWASTLVHEYTHFAEGTKEHQTLSEYLANDNVLFNQAKDTILSRNYGITSEGLDDLLDKITDNKTLTAAEMEMYQLFQSEVTAYMSEYMLGNEQFIDKIVAGDASLAEKIIKKIKNLKNAFAKADTPQSRAEIKRLKKAETLYLAAAYKANNPNLAKLINNDDDKEKSKDTNTEKAIDTTPALQYNKKSNYSQYQTLAMQWAFSNSTKAGDRKVLYNAATNSWNLLIAEDTDDGFSVLESIKDIAQNQNDIDELLKEKKNESNSGEQRGNKSSNGDFDKFRGVRRSHKNDSNSSKKWRTDGRSGGLSGSQPNSKRNGDTRQSTSNPQGDIKYSLKDSNGTTLSKAQQEYFKDSKAVDSNGRLLTLYHGGFTGTVFSGRGNGFAYNPNAIYLTDERAVASAFARGGDIKEVYANIKNPLILDANGNSYVDIPIPDDAPQSLKDYFFDTADADNLPVYAEEYGYDGVIIRNVREGVGGEPMTEVIALRSNQVKLTSNKTPTESEDIRYSLKDKLIGKTFPTYSESQGSNANELAMRWSRRGDIERGDYNVISYKDKFYLIEKLDDSDYGYQIVKELSEQGYEHYLEVQKNVGQEQSLHGEVHAFASFDKQRGSSNERKYHGNVGQHRQRGENKKILRVGGEQAQSRQTGSDRNGDSESGSSHSQGDNLKYSLKGDDITKKYYASLTDGQVKKLLADHTKLKVYSKIESEQIVNNIISNYLDFGEKYGVISGKTKRQAIEALWRGLNTAETGEQMGVALDIAEFIIQNAAVESVYNDMDNDTYVYTINMLKPFLHKLNLSSIKGEIKHHYGNNNSAYLLWGKPKNEQGYTADQVAQILEEQGFHIEANSEAEIFLQMDEAYRNAVNALKKQSKTILSSAMNATARNELKQQIAREVLLSFTNNGKPSKLSKLIDTYKAKANVWKQAYYDEKQRNILVNRIVEKAQKIKDIKKATFINASQFKNEQFKNTIEKLANIKYRANLNESGTRKILEELHKWYNKDNEIIGYEYVEEVDNMLAFLASGEGKLEVKELKMLDNVLDYFIHFIENHNKIYRNGAFVEAKPIAEKYIEIIHKNEKVHVGWLAKLFGKIFNNDKLSYFEIFADPMSFSRHCDKYEENGFYTETMNNLRKGAVDAAVAEMQMRASLDEFLAKNKRYMKSQAKRTITYKGKTLPVEVAISLYMTLSREQALRGLGESGFTYDANNKTFRVDGFATGVDLTIEELSVQARNVQNELAGQFTELDKEYVSIIEKIYNEDCKQAKRETDMLMYGYSNALEGYYVPIRRFSASNIDTGFVDEVNRASNASFNRDTVKGAKGELIIEPAMSVIDRHVRAVAMYSKLALPIKEFNILFNLDISGNNNKVVNVKSESVNTSRNAEKYMRQLVSDIQGIPTSKGVGGRLMSVLRSGYAKFQLGANIKVWLTQLSSFFAATSILSHSSIVKGLMVNTKDIDNYSNLAKLRNMDNTAALAQGVMDKVDSFGSALMKPIGKMDRFVVKKLFGACQVQVEKEQGLKLGTEENKIKAAELLEQVILETQQNSVATERSAAMRSGSEFMRAITMFSADSMKVFGRVIDSFGEYATLKAKRRAATEAAEIAELDKKINSSKKKVAKSMSALVTSAIFMALVAQLFRTLYNKDDEDENIAENMAVDAFGNLFGGLPLIRDIYARFTEGYEIDGFAYSALNDLMDSAYNIMEMTGDIFEGKVTEQDIAKNIKNMLYACGQIFGIPVRNMYNLVYGLTNRISPSSAYKIDTIFYNKSYRSDLAKAIEQDDEEMVATIVGLMLNENIGEVTNASVREELNSLASKGYDILPKSIGNGFTYDGETYSLTNKQISEFKEVYAISNEALASLIKLSLYSEASDEVKAKAVKYIYDTYYNLAIQDYLGVELETKRVLFAEAIDIEKLAIIVAMANSLNADTDKKGNTISGSKKKKIQSYINSLKLTAAQKYMVMGYLGYTNINGESQVKAYISKLNLTTSEKSKLLNYSGYAV